MSFDPTDFQYLLTILGRGSDAVRIGYQSTGDFHQQLFPHGALPVAVDALASEGNSVWFEINPSSYISQTGRSSVQHITRLAALWADLDFKDAVIHDPNGKTRVGGLGNIQNVFDVIDDITRALGSEPSAIVNTGGGLQPYWAFEGGDITEENRPAFIAMMKRWGAFVKQVAAQHGGGADSVFDLPRIFRVPGTRNHKKAYAEPRDVTVVFPNTGSMVDWEQVTQMLDDYGIPEVPEDDSTGEIVSPESDWEWADHDCIFVDQARTEIASSVPQARHAWGLKWASMLYGMIRGGCVTEQSFYQLRDLLGAKFAELCATQEPVREATAKELNELFTFGQQKAQQWTTTKLGDEMRNHIHADLVAELQAAKLAPVTSIFDGSDMQPVVPIIATVGTLALAVVPAAEPEPENKRLLGGEYTDTGNAEKLGQQIAGRFIHVPGIGWHEWSGSIWQAGAEERVMESTKTVIAIHAMSAQTVVERKWYQRSMSAGGLESAIKLARTLADIMVPASMLDASPYDFATPGGVVDLRTSTLRTADPLRDLHTHQSAVTPDWSCPTPRFTAFLQWALGDEERMRYMQRIFGIAAIGNVDFQQFPIFLGVGSNGKTTLTNFAVELFGSYAATMPQKFLVSAGDRHPTEIARLRGIRLAISNEVPPDAKFNEELVKVLTGEATLTARYMGQDFFEFPNTATHLMTANHLPTVLVGGASFFRRVRKVDFRNRIAPGDEQKDLVESILAEEGPGIMAWMLDGAKYAIAGGEQAPESVVSATQAYRFEEDALARFLEDQMVTVEGFGARRESAYNAYKLWCIREGTQPLTSIKFAREVIMIHPSVEDGSTELFNGLVLRDYRRDDQDA